VLLNVVHPLKPRYASGRFARRREIWLALRRPNLSALRVGSGSLRDSVLTDFRASKLSEQNSDFVFILLPRLIQHGSYQEGTTGYARRLGMTDGVSRTGNRSMSGGERDAGARATRGL
jgi:hypothetical protein